MIPLLLTLTVVILFMDVGATPFLHALISMITSPTLASPAPSHVPTPIFHMTLTPTEYDALHHVNSTDTFTSTSFPLLLASSTPNVFTKSLAGISYNIMCTKLNMLTLYAPT
ncbi:unnamed protein product [Spirodela intermedia]|uniref:Uncharacterized protein n=1 Tax=Spirodela intermedia TaxID=51605 RepID=A0A7I8KDT1_SPIIN|nr:unnamed protein product [Spirodela intermedia]